MFNYKYIILKLQILNSYEVFLLDILLLCITFFLLLYNKLYKKCINNYKGTEVWNH